MTDWTTPSITISTLLDALASKGAPGAFIDMDAVRWISVPAPNFKNLVPAGSTNLQLWTFSFSTIEDDPNRAKLILSDETGGWSLAWTDKDGYQESDSGSFLALPDVTETGADVPDPDAFADLYANTISRLLDATTREDLDAIGTEAGPAFRDLYNPRPSNGKTYQPLVIPASLLVHIEPDATRTATARRDESL